MVSSVSVIFDTVDSYSCSSKKGDFVKFEDNMFPRKFKVIAKGLDIYRFWIVEYSFRSERGHMIALRAQSYYVTGLTNDSRII